MTRDAINHSLWTVGLVLQFGLLAMAFLRKIAGRIPFFTVMLAFYPTRSVLLYVLARRLPPGDYVQLYRLLLLAALLVQVVLAAELGRTLWQSLDGWKRWMPVLVPLAAWGMTMGVWSMLPMESPAPPDRLQMFCSAMMVLLALLAPAGQTPLFVRKLTAGLGAYGAIDMAAAAGESVAAQKHAGSFAVWSYAGSVGYLAVLLFWMVSLGESRENSR